MDLWNYLKTVERPIMLYGMGDGAEKIYSRLKTLGISPSGVFASDGFARHNSFLGFEVISYSEAAQLFPDMIVLVCFGSSLPSVIDYVKSISGQFETYAPDVPVCGDGTFNEEFYLENKEKFDFVFNRLQDEQSRKVFKAMIDYKLSGKLSFLFDCESPYDEVYSNIIRLEDNEVFADLGAYRGDTVLDFIKRTNGRYNHIFAAEPDEKSFKKLIENTEQFGNITAVNAAVGAVCGKTHFSSPKGRGSKIEKTGTEIELITLDSLVCGKSPTFIKYDVEGAELDAVTGSQQTIKSAKPKLQIAAYHRNEDLFSIPLKVLELNPDYKVYLRHRPCFPAWDTDFYFI